MKRSIIKILMVACGLIFAMCTKDIDALDVTTTTSSADSGSLKLSFTPEDSFTLTSSADTRATTEEVVENDLINLWILLFDVDGNRIVPYVPSDDDEFYTADGELIAGFDPTTDNGYDVYDVNGQKIILDYDEAGNLIDQVYDADGAVRQGGAEADELYGSTYLASYQSKQTIYVDKALSAKIRHIRAVANTMTTNEYFNAENCPTLAIYQSITFRLENNAYRESDMWNTFDGKCYLRMAGFWDGEIAETGLDFNIAVLAKPIAAKVSVTYECIDETVPEGEDRAPSTIDVTSVQITRVPQNCYYRDVEDDMVVHSHVDYTSYQPRLVYDENYLNSDDGSVSFYVPQNLKGTAGSSYEDIAPEDKDLSGESLKTLYHAQDATCVVITGLYKYWDIEEESMEKKYVYIQLYPGDNSYDNYDVKLRHEYHLNCTITAQADTLKWSTDYRVTLSETLPEGAIVHYEFDPDNLMLNSAYDDYRDELGGYPREEGDYGYHEYLDSYRNPTYIKANAGTRTTTAASYYYAGYTDDSGNYVAYDYDAAGVFDLGIDGLSDYYDRYFHGFAGTTNAIAARYTEESTNTVLIRPFLRNLADPNPDYDNEDGKNPYYRLRAHPEVFNCTHIKDNFNRYTDTDLIGESKSGELVYYYPNNYINSSFIQLSTGWGAGLKPDDEEFTIVFIGSQGINTEMYPATQERGVYYGNSISWNKRWYFYRQDQNLNSDQDGNITYGLGAGQLISIDALIASNYQNVQSYDTCDHGLRKVYYNNVDVEAVQVASSVDSHYSKAAAAYDRPSTTEVIFDSPISIFGHITDNNKDDVIDGKLRLFLIYDRVLDLDEIDQIRRYAALKGLLLYGVDDYDGFDVKVTTGVEPAWDGEVTWNDGGGGDATFGTPASNE